MNVRPVVLLTRHFLGAIIAPPLLTDLGADYLRRTLSSVLAMLLVAGIFVTRAFFRKYMDLHAAWDVDAYLRAVEGDSLLMLALPMLVIGLIAVLIAPLMFLDETDYRTLAPLPVGRATIFASKLLAAAVVAGVAVSAVSALTSLWFPVATGGRWMPHSLGGRVGAHAIATIAGASWAFLVVLAIQGLCLTIVPRPLRARAGLIVQGAVFCGLLVSVPFVLRLPRMDVNGGTMSEPPLSLVPAAWFLGVERWLLGSAHEGYATAAISAGVAGAIAVLALAFSYWRLFVTLETLAATTSLPVWHVRWRAHSVRDRSTRDQPWHAVLAFIVHGLARSRLHAFVCVLIAAAAAAILVAEFLRLASGTHLWAARPGAAIELVVEAPLLVALALGIALRAAFLLPLDRAASWIFRITESAATRPRALDAIAAAFERVLLIAPLATALALQPAILGPRWPLAAGLTVLAAFVLVEILLREWRRLPFTCTYLPGKRVLAHTLGVLLAAYFLFVYLGANVIRWSLLHPSRMLFVGGVLLAAGAAMRRSRLRTWGGLPLEFVDEDPLAVRTLDLLGDERRD